MSWLTVARRSLVSFDPCRWSYTAPFLLGLRAYNVYGSESTRLPQESAGMAPARSLDDVVVTKTSDGQQQDLPGTVGTEEVARAALLPQPAALIAMRILLTNIPAVCFTVANVTLLAVGMLCFTTDSSAIALRHALWSFALPILAIELLLFALTMLLAVENALVKNLPPHVDSVACVALAVVWVAFNVVMIGVFVGTRLRSGRKMIG